jgi:hypothetical protein
LIIAIRDSEPPFVSVPVLTTGVAPYTVWMTIGTIDALLPKFGLDDVFVVVAAVPSSSTDVVVLAASPALHTQERIHRATDVLPLVAFATALPAEGSCDVKSLFAEARLPQVLLKSNTVPIATTPGESDASGQERTAKLESLERPLQSPSSSRSKGIKSLPSSTTFRSRISDPWVDQLLTEQSVECCVHGSQRDSMPRSSFGGGLNGDAISVGLGVNESKHDKLLESAQADRNCLFISGTSISWMVELFHDGPFRCDLMRLIMVYGSFARRFTSWRWW